MKQKIMQLITQIRNDNKVSQDKFARELSKALEPVGDVSTSTVRNWEKGRNLPDYFMLHYVSLQETPAWLRDFAIGAMSILRSKE